MVDRNGRQALPVETFLIFAAFLDSSSLLSSPLHVRSPLSAEGPPRSVDNASRTEVGLKRVDDERGGWREGER